MTAAPLEPREGAGCYLNKGPGTLSIPLGHSAFSKLDTHGASPAPPADPTRAGHRRRLLRPGVHLCFNLNG